MHTMFTKFLLPTFFFFLVSASLQASHFDGISIRYPQPVKRGGGSVLPFFARQARSADPPTPPPSVETAEPEVINVSVADEANPTYRLSISNGIGLNPVLGLRAAAGAKPETKTKTGIAAKAKATAKTPAPSKSTPSPTPNSKPKGTPGSFTGDATYYATGLGACGITNQDTDMVGAVSRLLYDGFEGFQGTNPNDNPICNRRVEASFEGKSVSVIIVDRCQDCAYGDFDFSPTAFQELADLSRGRVGPITWRFV